MIRSMTGYGRAETTGSGQKITIEIKSVNYRGADYNIRLPRNCIFLEQKIRSLLKESVFRGKVDVFVTMQESGEESGRLSLNIPLAGEYVKAMRQMAEVFGLDDRISVSELAKAPDVLTLGNPDLDEDAVWESVRMALLEALERYNAMRAQEGEKLRADILDKLGILERLTREVIEHEPEIMAAYRLKLTDTVHELLGDRSLDESRIAAECVLYADKICTDEETVRLLSHISQMRDVLSESGSIGRRLDFIAQEMNREANTTLSKAGDLLTADTGISMKTEIEKIREQIQNIE